MKSFKSLVPLLILTVALVWGIRCCSGRWLTTHPSSGKSPASPSKSEAARSDSPKPAPAILFVSPKGSTEGRKEGDMIIVTFNQPMVPITGVPGDEKAGPLLIEPTVPGKYRWQGTCTLTLIPETPLPGSTTFRARIPAGTKSLSGESLKEDYIWDFETPRIKLVASIPDCNKSGVKLEPEITLRFNQNISIEKARPFIKFFQETSSSDRMEIGFTLAHNNQDMSQVALMPERKLTMGSTYGVSIMEGMPADGGDLGIKETRDILFTTYGELEILGINNKCDLNPEEELVIRFTNPVSTCELLKNIRIEPSVEIPEWKNADDYSDSTLSFNIPFKPEKNYKIWFSANLRDIYGNRLGSSLMCTVKTKPYGSALSMREGEGVVEAYGDLKYPIRFVNIEKVRMQKALISREKVIPLLMNARFLSDWDTGYKFNPGKGFFSIDRIWKIVNERNHAITLPIGLDEILPWNRHGLVYLQVDDMMEKDYGRYHKSLIQVTDMGLTAKLAPEKSLIYATRLKDASGVDGASVEIRDEKNRILWRGVTDWEGMADAPGWAELGLRGSQWDNPGYYVMVSKDDDLSFVSSQGGTGISPWDLGIPYDYSPAPREFQGRIYTEKGLYRAGDRVHIKGIVREKIEGDWAVSKGGKLSLTIINSRNEELLSKEVTLSPFGSFDLSFTLDQKAPSGSYSIEANLTGKDFSFAERFRVEAYKPAQFEVRVKGDKESYFFGDKFNGEIRGWYLFGAPMAGEEIKWSLRRSPESYEPPGWEHFTFGPGYHYYGREREEALIASGKGTLDSKGLALVTATVNPGMLKGSARLTLEGTVTSQNRQSISRREEFVVHHGQYSIGLRTLKRFYEKGDPVSVTLVTVNPGGEILNGRDVTLKLLKSEWRSYRREVLAGRYEWSSEWKGAEVKKLRLVSGSQPVTAELSIREAGEYTIRAESRDKRGNDIVTETEVYVSGYDYFPWERKNGDQIELIADRQHYKPGDTARIMVKSPFENAKALVTLERELVLERFTCDLRGSADVIEIPIKEKYLPNVFVSVTLLSGRTANENYSESGEDLGKPTFRIGYANLNVEPDNRRLIVKVESDRLEYRPKERVTLSLKVLDSLGRGRRSEVSLAVVDRGVLDLIGYGTPDYFESFYGPRPLSVHTSMSLLDLVGQYKFGEKGGNRSGGGGEGQNIGELYRSNFKDTAYWKPVIITDDKGCATLTFRLPENLTTFRVMATAHTMDSCFGAGSSEFVVKKPLMLRPSLPRLARAGDVFQAGVVVNNGTGRPCSVKIRSNATGISTVGAEEREITLIPGEESEVLFFYNAESAGRAIFSFHATTGKESDGVRTSIPVQVPCMTEAVALYNSTGGTQDEVLLVPQESFYGIGSIEVTASSTALVGLRSGLQSLLEYPYG